ncbi:MAG: twin-arginine translocase TatA/TatE family subunit [Acidimicrobiia bacterium]|nr:twin-arginine translocase TatA/TatE family subunit [Acidimicrobiia bacterium]
MWSVSPAEMVTIAIVALLVFGPRRLPEIARKAGRMARDLKNAAADLRSDLEREYGESLQPLEDARREMRTTMQALEEAGEPLRDLPRPQHRTRPAPSADGSGEDA